MEYKELENCKLCAWECGVDRLAGEQGVCLAGLPKVASCQLHPAPPQSYTIFCSSCNFRCLNCQNWEIAHYPFTQYKIKGIVNPEHVARVGVQAVNSNAGQMIGADRFFFSGGSPTVSLPWIEEVVQCAKTLDPDIKINFDTNGFPSKNSFRRIISISDSLTFDIKAYNDEVHRTLTGAPVEPVLTNVQEMARQKDQLWEFRILVIPNIVDLPEIQAITEFIVSLDETLPVSFLTFRPNFCLDTHPGASRELMEAVVTLARRTGLTNVHWAGFSGIPGVNPSIPQRIKDQFSLQNSAVAAFYAQRAGCRQIHRDCGKCSFKLTCDLKGYYPCQSR
ncbi:MAG: radical SAM protein [Candidatus Heimdallarchaeota archaeon]|nr:MAG: radical SAM protein [Candidatus Heimdallarchaeota archaeon]